MAPSANAEAVVDIVVTGSRIGRSFDQPNPVTVLTQVDIQKLGLVNAADVVAQLPQNSQFVSSANVGAGNFNIGASLANLRGLNPFFGSRTLTLVDSKRFVPTTDGGAVDLNVIPSMLISRVEIVTGGASAVYGSDAIAGVVNILLDTRLQGLKAQLDYGITSEGDGRNVHASGAYGTGFADDRGHIVFGLEYEKANAIGGCSVERDWCATNDSLFTNATNVATPAGPFGPAVPANGLPRLIIGPNGRNFNSQAGLFPLAFPGPLQFNTAGTALVPYAVGNFANAFSFSPMQGGADPSQDRYRDFTLRPEVKRIASFAHAEYEFSDALKIYVQGSYATRDAINVQPNSGASVFANTIQADNVFLPAGAAATLGLGLFPGGAPFSSDGSALPDAQNNTGVKVWRGVIGLAGKLSDDWSWDAYYTNGRNKTRQRVANSKVSSFFNFALDAIDDPNQPGINPGCRAVLLNNAAAAGCRPLNLFGMGNASPDSIAYAYRTLAQDTLYTQQVASGSIRGDLFEGWGAGPVGVAAGAEYRRETIGVTHNLAEQPYYFSFERGYGGDYAGKNEVIESFAEVSVPLVRDAWFAKLALLNGAIRQTHNRNTDRTLGGSNGVDFTTWKVNAIWDVADWLRFRGTRSRDVRAPSFYELFSRSTVTGGFFGTVTNPASPGPQQQAAVTLGGNAGTLRPEVADTWTAGVVLNGVGALRGFQASADWFQVKIDGPISSLGGAQAVIDTCFQQRVYCNQVSGAGTSPSGLPTSIATVGVPNLNLGKYTTRGLDMELGYNTRVGTGNINLRAIGSYLYDLIIDPGTGATVYNFAGVSGPTDAFGYFNTGPKWQANAFATYSNGGFAGTLQARYVGRGKYRLLTNGTSGVPLVAPGDAGFDPTLANSINDNSVKSAVFINLSLQQRVSIGSGDDRWFEFFGSVNNLLNKKPSIAPGGNGYPTNPVYYDTFGTSVRVGVRVRI